MLPQFGPETDRYLADVEQLWTAEHSPGPGRAGVWRASFGDQSPAAAIAAFITP